MILDYYELIEPWEPELTGIKDGSSQAIVSEKGFKNKQFYKEFIRVFANPTRLDSEEAMKTEFDLECVKLKKGAILTDFLSFAPMSYWLVSSKVFSILTKYNLGNHRFFTARIEDIKGYHFFYKEILDWDVIDFRRCEFMKGNDYDGYRYVPIHSKEEFLKDRFVKVKKVVVTNVQRNADMFKVKLPVGILISSPLYQELASVNVTGIKFNKIDVEIADI